jgi:tRNA pseudouridine55 synthase
MAEQKINGIINVYKEAGYTSHDVVAKLRGILKTKKIGHTGTLDPEAVGVLPVCIGNATKLCDMLMDKTKEYEAKLLLGKMTDTQDTTGKVLQESESWKTLEVSEIRNVIEGFVGEYSQIPPMYSALKVNGKKLYDLARAGIEVERTPRQVHIYQITILDIQLPYICLRVKCSKGTYIRTLCQDIGERLGCGGCMAQLARTATGGFGIQDSYTLSQIESLWHAGDRSCLLDTEQALQHYPVYQVLPEAEKYLKNGNQLQKDSFRDMLEPLKDGERIRVRNAEGQFWATYRYDKKIKLFKVDKMFM